MSGFADMVGSLSGKDSIVRGDVSSVGGSSSQSQAFAANLCTKLGACHAAGVEVASPSTGRGR